MRKDEKLEIKKPYLLLCEGADAQYFLIYMLNSKAFSDEPQFASDIQVMDFGGIRDLRRFLKVLRMSANYEMVKTILVIRDAETNHEEAWEQVQGQLRSTDLPVPEFIGVWQKGGINVGVLLFPQCDQEPSNGTLEDLCLNLLKGEVWEHYEPVVEDFLGSAEKLAPLPRRFKNKLHGYFAATDKYVGLKIGEAARAGAFAWDSKRLAFLKDFILKGF